MLEFSENCINGKEKEDHRTHLLENGGRKDSDNTHPFPYKQISIQDQTTRMIKQAFISQLLRRGGQMDLRP